MFTYVQDTRVIIIQSKDTFRSQQKLSRYILVIVGSQGSSATFCKRIRLTDGSAEFVIHVPKLTNSSLVRVACDSIMGADCWSGAAYYGPGM